MFVCSFITIGFRATKAKGITNTGHDDIKELDFKDTNSGYLLLNQMSGYQISRDLKRLINVHLDGVSMLLMMNYQFGIYLTLYFLGAITAINH